MPPLSAPPSMLRVKWGTRTVGLNNVGGTATIIQKASEHFRVERCLKEDLVLVGEVERYQLELTDDLLNRLESGDLVILTHIRRECDVGFGLGNASEATLVAADKPSAVGAEDFRTGDLPLMRRETWPATREAGSEPRPGLLRPNNQRVSSNGQHHVLPLPASGG
ncbi:hypothetical protein DICSQDRAFT_182434, partial [Dichomitus squalens LYAD-421 SS1]